MNRRQLREEVFKCLFRIEFNPIEEIEEQIENYLSELTRATETDIEYIKGQAFQVIKQLELIDTSINEKAEHWKISRMAKVDVTILRLAIYEINYDENIPTNVAINEAVELAKKYGGDASPSFVNGILAKLVEK